MEIECQCWKQLRKSKGVKGELFKIKFYNANELIILHNYVLHEWFQDFIFYIMDFGKFVNPLH